MKTTTHRIEKTSKKHQRLKRSNPITLKIVGAVVIILVAVGAYNKYVTPNKSNEISQVESTVETTENDSEEISEVETDIEPEQQELFTIFPKCMVVTENNIDYDDHILIVITDDEPHNEATQVYVTLFDGNTNEEIETFSTEFDEYASSSLGYYAFKDLFVSDFSERLTENINEHSIIVVQLSVSEQFDNEGGFVEIQRGSSDAVPTLREHMSPRPSWYEGATFKK